MLEDQTLSHQGTVTGYQGGKAVVSVPRPTACGGCRARDFCGHGHGAHTEFAVPRAGLAVGDRVVVEISPKTGIKAMFWAYLCPFLLVLAAIAWGTAQGWGEQWSGLLAIGLLPPYYWGVSRFRASLKAQLHLKVSKI